ncbi:WD40-repeat-containing domain protein [Phlyctochytrium arcticum]|nr:WD40-repeat-containing domain protein [Phlyctochytrium arcticum]
MSIPGIRGGAAIPFSKAAPKDEKKELRKYYGEAIAVLGRAKANTVELQIKSNRENLLKDGASYRSERQMNLAHFAELMNIFKKASKYGDGKLNMHEFKTAFSVVLGHGLTDEQMSVLFMKVDANMDEAVDWDEFSTFMLLRAQGQTMMQEQAETQLFETESMSTHFPIQTPHKDMITKILWLGKMGRYLTCSRDGTVCCWSDRIKLQRSFPNVVISHHPPQPGTNSKYKAPWIHDCICLPNLNKLALSSDDHEITFYDCATLEPQLRLDLHDSIAFTLSYHFDSENPDSDQSMILYGTDQGYVNLLHFSHAALFGTSSTKKDHVPVVMLDSLAKSPGTQVWKRKAHNDWVIKVEYYHDLRAIVSCSPDSKDSLVMATQVGPKKWTFVSSSVHKGVNAFSYCRSPLALVTGGTDRQIRIWNPHRLQRPIAALAGHSSPITIVTTNPLNGQAISLSVDKAIKIWDIRKQQCLQTLNSGVEHRPENTLSAMFFSTHNGGKLIVASSSMITYSLVDHAQKDRIKSHDAPIRAALYNAVFKQIVSGCDASVVNVWDSINGTKTFRFAEAHGKAEITAMAFDSAGRKLITGGRDGSIRSWNFNNGQLLQVMVKGDRSEVTGILYITLKSTPYIITTGWNRLIHFFPAASENSSVSPILELPAAHKDDVLTMAFAEPDLLATASYDGEIVLTSLGSGSVIGRLTTADDGERGRSIDKVLFLHSRLHLPKTGHLLSSGSDGYIRWWNTYQNELMLTHDGTPGRNEGIFSMATNPTNTILVTGDTEGFISVWDISETCMGTRPRGMIRTGIFRAHMRSVVSLDLMDGYDAVVSASTDCTVRVFTLQGHYIGTFGQPTPWDITNPSTYAHPMKPTEIADFEAAVAAARESQLEASQVSPDTTDPEYPTSPSGAYGRAPPSQHGARPPPTPVTPTPTYQTWYAKTQFAEKVTRPPRRPRNLPRMSHPKYISGATGIFHRLEPYELAEIGRVGRDKK